MKRPYFAGRSSTLVARISYASAAFWSFLLRWPISRSACASFSATFSRHSAAVNMPDQTRCGKSCLSKTGHFCQTKGYTYSFSWRVST
jgi:hypothetical protein